jgi:hypothetical protein
VSIKVGRKILDHINYWLIVVGSCFLNLILVNSEWHALSKFNSAPKWFAAVFFLSAYMVNIAIFDWIFFGWAKIRFDMYVQSGCIRKSGARYERVIYVRTEQEEHFIPEGQELVVRNTVGGHAKIVAVPETPPQS